MTTMFNASFPMLDRTPPTSAEAAVYAYSDGVPQAHVTFWLRDRTVAITVSGTLDQLSTLLGSASMAIEEAVTEFRTRTCNVSTPAKATIEFGGNDAEG